MFWVLSLLQPNEEERVTTHQELMDIDVSVRILNFKSLYTITMIPFNSFVGDISEKKQTMCIVNIPRHTVSMFFGQHMGC